MTTDNGLVERLFKRANQLLNVTLDSAPHDSKLFREAAEALRAKREMQEPVAWMCEDNFGRFLFALSEKKAEHWPKVTPLYAMLAASESKPREKDHG